MYLYIKKIKKELAALALVRYEMSMRDRCKFTTVHVILHFNHPAGGPDGAVKVINNLKTECMSRKKKC